MSTADNPPADPPSALPRGTRLAEFELRRVLGIGGFGIVYLAFDHALEREVAVKEYMPSSLVGRSGPLQVSLLSQANAEPFSLGLRSFVNEARLLARFDHPSLVKVHRYWEANGTAYMAMPYYTGSNLHATRRRMAGPPSETWLRNILEPLLGAIERLHGEGVYHRDISPDNVILQPDGRPVLLDFGAARRVLGDKSMALTAILKPAYAPIEQYAEAGAVKQGPWTDFYSLGATLHFLLLGRAPTPATTRTVVDEMPPLAGQTAALPGCSAAFLQCVDWMLQPRPADRPQNVAALRARLAQALLDHAAEVAAGAQASGDGLGGWPTTQLLGAAGANSAGTAEGNAAGTTRAATVIDLSALPATVAPPPTPDISATVLMPRADQATPDATVVMSRAGAIPPDATVVMPRTATPGADATVVMPRTAMPGVDATVVMPRTLMPPAAHDAGAAATATPTASATPSAATPPGAAQSAPAGSAAHRTDPTLHDRPDPTANDADPRGRAAAARPPAWRWPAAAGAAGAAGLALWWGLQGPAPQPGAGSAPAQAAASQSSAASVGLAAMPVADPAASANSPGLATAAAPVAGAAPTAPDNTAAAAAVLTRGNGKPASTPGAPANKVATSAATKPAAAAKTTTQHSAPEPAPAPAAAVAGPAGPPSLATSITRLPPAAEPAAAHPAPATAALRQAAAPGPDAPRPGAAGGTAASTSGPGSVAPLPASPSAVVNPATAVTPPRAAPVPAARAPERDAEPVLLQTRALSPVERCEGRVLVALWACIDRLCKAEAALRDHPDCVKARREQDRGAAAQR